LKRIGKIPGGREGGKLCRNRGTWTPPYVIKVRRGGPVEKGGGDEKGKRKIRPLSLKKFKQDVGAKRFLFLQRPTGTYVWEGGLKGNTGCPAKTVKRKSKGGPPARKTTFQV